MELDLETVKRNVATALHEDIGPGDINAALIPARTCAKAKVVTREQGIFCGRPWVDEACRQVDAAIALGWRVADGQQIAAGDILLELTGPARGLLSVERTIVNFMQLLSATATRTRRYVEAVADTGATILDTRKTLPGLRMAQKYAVHVGGARNHRMGLFDAYLLKENHIAAAGGIATAVHQAWRQRPTQPVQVEVENADQLAEALAAGVDSVLLDNYSIKDLRAAVASAAAVSAAADVALEASGGITLEIVRDIALTGVDYISVGELTKNVTPLDMSMLITTTDD